MAQKQARFDTRQTNRGLSVGAAGTGETERLPWFLMKAVQLGSGEARIGRWKQAEMTVAGGFDVGGWLPASAATTSASAVTPAC